MTHTNINRRTVLRGGVALAAVGVATMTLGPLALAQASGASEIHVYKDPNCGCCSAWIEHLEADGFTVVSEDRNDMAAVKDRLEVPRSMRSCHTAVIGDYVIEGHVPAADIRRLLAARPDALGLAVPGMPIGSPGMEMGNRQDSYKTWLIRPDGEQVFTDHPAANA